MERQKTVEKTLKESVRNRRVIFGIFPYRSPFGINFKIANANLWAGIIKKVRNCHCDCELLARAHVLKFTSVVGNDTTVHDVHTNTGAFSPSILIKCGICPHHQTLTRTP